MAKEIATRTTLRPNQPRFFIGFERGAGRNRTDESRFCRPLPYHLATAPGRLKSPKRPAFSTPQALHEFCRPREDALVLNIQMHDPAHQSLDATRTSLLQQAPSRRR